MPKMLTLIACNLSSSWMKNVTLNAKLSVVLFLSMQIYIHVNQTITSKVKGNFCMNITCISNVYYSSIKHKNNAF